MRPVPVEKARFEQTRDVMMLDDAEMALSLLDLAATRTAIVDPRRPPVQPTVSPDLLGEYAAAASLIFDRVDAEAIARELEIALREHSVAA
jgi:hypothetical protein